MVVSDQRSPPTCSQSFPEMFLLVVLRLLIISVGGWDLRLCSVCKCHLSCG